ncbi:MAG: hypothetical protein QF858_00840 [Candidatus Pacebacteria bacterium]|jgi:hypothetical protein|nr:hypothetical protein [Candidatus Paceibacterota bacterium]MDP6659538.1 hypothetical protein [Candidatus Paceibacterota bacterium]|tara:strand:- start:12589 stop:13341 length:753 start_codon:yes stop_codon:yes gene_type:complete
MDNIKDNKLSDRNKSSFNVDPFGENKACIFAYQKAERISVAIHLVTNFVPEGEPVRNVLRDKSISVLSDILTLRGGLRSTGSENVNGIIAKLYEIVSLLTVVQSSGHISAMNLDIIKNECNSLCAFLREVEDMEGSESLNLPVAFFKVYSEPLTMFKGQKVKDTQKSFKEPVTSKGQVKERIPRASKGHGKRRDAILALFGEKERINVKDAAVAIPDCSEKTLQRELVSMVSEGILKKEGERRWSTYSLV